MWYDDESRNHHMYSCPIAWFHNTLLGIRQDERLFGIYDHPEYIRASRLYRNKASKRANT